MLRSANVQLVVQHAEGCQLREKLYKVEEKKNESVGARRQKVKASKYGRHLTGAAFRKMWKDLDKEEEKENKVMHKKKAIREVNKEKREWRVREVQARKDQRAQDLDVWKADIELCQAAKQKLPPKPRALKKQSTPDDYEKRLAAIDEEESDEELARDSKDEGL